MEIVVRSANEADASECGRICYEGFLAVNKRHGFPSNFPSVESATRRVASFISDPAVFALVAEPKDNRGGIIGFNFLSERDPIRAVGPIVIDPNVHQRGIGRTLMQAVLERASGARGVRLMQETYNVQSLSLYVSLGFEVREMYAVMTGEPKRGLLSGDWKTRPMTLGDLAECAGLHEAVHGYSRKNELADAINAGTAVVAIRDGRVRGYQSFPTNWPANHGVAETDEDMEALLAGAAELVRGPLSFMLPVRRGSLFRWCINQGLRAVKPMTMMTIGEYRQPQEVYSPSVLY